MEENINVCLLNILHSCNCFLIEPDNIVKPNTNGTSTCLSINEFLDEKKEFNHQIYKLKHDNDQTLTILTEQLKHKITFLESKLSAHNKQNDSAELLDLNVKYTLMAGNLSQLNTNYVDLQRRYYTQDLVVRLTNLTLELEKKVSALENLKKV
ncbi:Hypothetical predicted protein [Mytilus galloprovincialis]|uniref:Uncharacterized protein n=1 Tax=Mytilus galloprovincialis TaxID=29158 RepID=A0A8B6EX87_MYTGA|nr:Hypothetical predicted protein [Mytilus galloprovincialis]